MSATTTTWTGSNNGTWDTAANWSLGAPTSNGNPVWPGEVAVIAAGSADYVDVTLQGTTVLLDGTQSAPVLVYLSVDGTTLGPGTIFSDAGSAPGGILEGNGDLDNQGTILADASGGILQVDPITASNSLLRELWTSEGLLRATNGGTLEIGQSAAVQEQESQSNSLPEFDYLQSNGIILADDGGTVQLNNSAGSEGEIIASGGTILVAAGPGESGVAQIYNALTTVPGPGIVYISNGGVLDDAGGIGEPVYFTDTTGTLILNPDTAEVLPLLGPVEGFKPGDTIEIPGATITNLAYVFGQLTLGQPGTITFDIGSVAEQITLDGDYRQDAFTVTSNGQGIVVSGFAGTGSGTDTVAGTGGATHSLALNTPALAALAAPVLAGITPAQALFVDAAGAATLGASQTAAVIDATGPVNLTGNGAANETIAASAFPFAFKGGSGSGSVFAGAGADSIYLPGGGNWFTALGNGADTVVAATGADTIGTGTGGSFVFLGSGASSVGSAGADTVLGSTGSATISALGSNDDEVFALGGPLQFAAGIGASTVVAGQAATLFGGASGGTLMFGDGATRYFGSGATDTVVGLQGSLTVLGGAGGGEYFGGSAGNNMITAGTGAVTAFGAGAGDVLIASGGAADLFAGGVGAETLTGVGSTGNNTFFAGYGPETLAEGSGQTALVAGTASDLFEVGSGVTLLLFVAGRTFNGSDTITGWNPAQDFVKLAGYATPEASVLANATVANGSTTLALSDGTHITFAGVTSLNAGNFN